MNYGKAECELMDDGRPPPRCGNFFVSVHSGNARSTADNQLYELFDFSITLTMRVTVPLDRVGDQQIARNIALVPLGQRKGFNHKVMQLRAYLHMNWQITVLQNQTPSSANDNLAAWASGTVYGFIEPMRYKGFEKPVLVGGEWFGAGPDKNGQPATDVGIKSELRFEGCKRFQPVTAAIGPFV
jgi:hypothetical protein